jgi:hypothetical protein
MTQNQETKQKQPYVEPTLEKREQLAEVTELTKITGPVG